MTTRSKCSLTVDMIESAHDVIALDQYLQLTALHAVGGVVRTGVHATGLAVERDAQVAGGGLLLHDGFADPGVGRVVGKLARGETMHVDVAIGAVFGALA